MQHKMKISLLTILLISLVTVINGQSDSRKKVSPHLVPKKVILIDEVISVNSQDTIFVQSIQFPLMSETEKLFVNKRITDYRSSRIKQFIDAFFNRDRLDKDLTQNFNHSQHWKFEVVYQSQTELALLLSAYEFTGGAHGNTSVKNFNFDLKNLKSYRITDKFSPLDLDKIAQYCTDYCIDNNIPIFDNIIKANPDLLKVWNFTNEGLLLTFPQYTIAPYSSGIIQIHIPKNDLPRLRKIN